MRLYTVLLYFLQTALHVSEDNLTHHQEHIQTVITTSGVGTSSDSSTSADGSKYGSTSARCSYSLRVLLLMNEGIIVAVCDNMAVCQGTTDFPKIRSHLHIPYVRKVTWSRFRPEDPQFWGDLWPHVSGAFCSVHVSWYTLLHVR